MANVWTFTGVFLVTIMWVALFVFVGRFVSRHDRERVFEILQIFAVFSIVLTLTLAGTAKLGYLSKTGKSTGWVGNVIEDIIVGELNWRFGFIVFFVGCIILFVPTLISRALGRLLNCLPVFDPALEHRSISERAAERVALEARRLFTPIWFIQMKAFLDPFHLLSLFLVKCLVAAAAAVTAVFLAGYSYPGHWFRLTTAVIAMKTVGAAAALLSLAIVFSFLLDATQQTILDQPTWNAIMRDLRGWAARRRQVSLNPKS